MALLVEDGSIVADAESYCSVADADAYFLARGNATWAAIATTELKEIALRKATDYMEQNYRQLWLGYRVDISQSLSWPRSDVVIDGFTQPADEVPEEVVRACAELAVRASASTLLGDVDNTTTQVTHERLGDMEVDYAVGNAAGVISYKAVEFMLAPFFGSPVRGIRSVEVSRA